MRELYFYNTSSRDFLGDITQLIERLYIQEHKVIVLCPDNDVSAIVDEYLWSYKDESFLPHIKVDKDPSEFDSIVISSYQLNLESYKTLIVFKGSSVEIDYINYFKKVYYFFDNSKNDEREVARTLWKEAIKSGTKCKYWQVQENKWILVRSG